MNESFQKDLELAKQLISDSDYLRDVVVRLDNNASSSNSNTWKEEVKYSIANYKLADFLDESSN
ncbi:hypothetical protein [Leptospira ilyithenensis]|uniref:Uncharacterized protein n=1 Tax=Leptospira ilyithenensis TaxID=2484901 RepID=A0A4R9LKU7_9LEPT|nr:hypothetical protein [Leptospira ilyithenensis]TGN06553.1 hypothetical protein EHS11_19580 [Leptospira ilyithenensis]